MWFYRRNLIIILKDKLLNQHRNSRKNGKEIKCMMHPRIFGACNTKRRTIPTAVTHILRVYPTREKLVEKVFRG